MNCKKYWSSWLMSMALIFVLMGCEDRQVTVLDEGEATVKSSDGLSIRYEVDGRGDTALVFVHCWSCDSSFWDAQFNYFSDQYRVVRLDLAGHGFSDHGRKKYTIASFGADVAAVVRHLDLKQVVLIGHSMGGPASVEASKLLGDRIIGVVGVDTFYTGFPYPKDDAGIEAFVKPFKDDFSKTLSGMVHSMFPKSTAPELVESIDGIMQDTDRKMAVEAMYDLFYWSRREVPASLNALGTKLRNINGEPVVKDYKQHPSVKKIAGTGHFVHLERPYAFNKALADFIKDFETGK